MSAKEIKSEAPNNVSKTTTLVSIATQPYSIYSRTLVKREELVWRARSLRRRAAPPPTLFGREGAEGEGGQTGADLGAFKSGSPSGSA